MPLKSKTLTGGILADEMGLGKTLEVLATILLNTRTTYPPVIPLEIDLAKVEKNSKARKFSCLCGEQPESFNTYGPVKP